MAEVDRERHKHEGEGCFYTDLQVMRSNAGWYIGRACWDVEGGYPEPYSRESDYYGTEAEAAKALPSFTPRRCLENDHGYATGALPLPGEKN